MTPGRHDQDALHSALLAGDPTAPLGTLGFHVYGAKEAKRMRLTGTLIRAQGGLRGRADQ